MDKERVRSWLGQRWRERAPLPPMEQIRRELGWSKTPKPATQRLVNHAEERHVEIVWM